MQHPTCFKEIMTDLKLILAQNGLASTVQLASPPSRPGQEILDLLSL